MKPVNLSSKSEQTVLQSCFSLSRLMLLVLLGACLTPFAGFIGALAIPGAFMLLAGALLVLITTFSLKAVTAVLIATAIYGAQFAWPVTCVVFPAITLALRRSNAFTPLLLSAVGAVAGPSLVYLLVKMKMVLLNQTDLDHFMIGGLASGAVLGATFGFAVWRFDHLSRKEIAILP